MLNVFKEVINLLFESLGVMTCTPLNIFDVYQSGGDLLNGNF